MTFLTLLLIVKIAGTLLGVGLPMLLLPQSRIERLLGSTSSSPLMYRLYGVAIIALCIGYAFGIPDAEAGILPLEVIIMGLVSNGGAVLILALSKRNRLQTLMMIFLAMIVMGLIVTLLMPGFMLA